MRLFIEYVIPAADRELGGHDDGLLFLPCVEDGEEPGASFDVQVHQSEVIDYEEIIGRHLVDELQLLLFGFGQFGLGQKYLGGTEVGSNVLPHGEVCKGACEVALSRAGLPCDEQDFSFPDPFAGEEPLYTRV